LNYLANYGDIIINFIYSGMFNRDLLNRISKYADEKAFEEIFLRYNEWLFSVARTIVHSNETAEEIIEDVFFKLWQIKDRYFEINNLESYLYVSVKNLSYDYLRKSSKYRYTEIVENEIKEIISSPDEIYLIKELRAQIDVAIDKLPNRCKEIFQMVRMERLSYKETAQLLKISPKTVENQLRIATQKIMESLHDYLLIAN